jgi:TIR domain
MKRRVFISHSSQDKKIADAVCNFLEKHGVLCWIAPRDVTPGKNYGAAIIDAISECELFVLILSSLSNRIAASSARSGARGQHAVRFNSAAR